MGKPFFGLRGQTLNYVISAVAGCDFLLFGYDQGVMGGILTMESFLNQFPEIDPAQETPGVTSAQKSTYQGIAVACYNLGCFLGAIATIWVGNILGRRRMIFMGTAIMVVGAILQASAYTLEHFIIGRIITGIGNGFNTSTVPTWQSETSKSHKRGKMVMIEGALISGGIMVSNWVDLGFSFTSTSVAWRFPLAFQCFFCLLILAFVLNLPESPRWLIMKGRNEEAVEVLAVLADLEPTDKLVRNEFANIQDAVMEQSKGKFSDVFKMNRDRNFHRAALGYLTQTFQQISGCNLITYYAPIICRDLGMSETLALIIASCIATEYFLISWPPVFVIERAGRRNLMMYSALLQAIIMGCLGGFNSQPQFGFGIAVIVFLFLFNSVFAFGWLGMGWLYPAEIVPLRIRAPSNALSTSANWIFNFMVVMITPVAFETIGYKTYIIFAVINLFMSVTVYMFFPETAYRSLEEIDSIFHRVSDEAQNWYMPFMDVRQAARDEPRRYGKNGELLIEHDEAVKKGSPGIGSIEHAEHVVEGGVVAKDEKDAESTSSGGVFTSNV